MTDLRERLAGALCNRLADLDVSGCRFVADNLVDVVMSELGRRTDVADTLRQLRYNSHDLGELGTFVRLEYASQILAAAVQAQEEQ